MAVEEYRGHFIGTGSDYDANRYLDPEGIYWWRPRCVAVPAASVEAAKAAINPGADLDALKHQGERDACARGEVGDEVNLTFDGRGVIEWVDPDRVSVVIRSLGRSGEDRELSLYDMSGCCVESLCGAGGTVERLLGVRAAWAAMRPTDDED